jgi:hypothetical protein
MYKTTTTETTEKFDKDGNITERITTETTVFKDNSNRNKSPFAHTPCCSDNSSGLSTEYGEYLKRTVNY